MLSAHDHGNCELCQQLEDTVAGVLQALRALRDTWREDCRHMHSDPAANALDSCIDDITPVIEQLTLIS